MKIRKAVVDDLPKLKALHDRAVLELCSKDYTNEQLAGWITSSPLEKYFWRLENQRIFLVEKEGALLGFVRWYPETNELCSICVEPAFARQGIGARLMAFAVDDARDHGVEKLWLKASLNAVPFYEALGWVKLELSRDGPLPYLKMEKLLV